MNGAIGKALFVTTLIAMTLLAACLPASPSQDAAQSPLAPASPLESPERAASPEQTLAANAQADLAGQLDVSPDEIEVVSVEAVEWGDSSLGCPQEGMMYAQMITPGYRIILSYGGETYAYHSADQADSPVIYCPDDESSTAPAEEAQPPERASDALVKAVTADLAEQLGASPDEIEVVSTEAVDWPDSSLGCPQEGMMYAQMITPGYRIILSYEGETYAYHTGADADNPFILCPNDDGAPIPAADAEGDAMQSMSAALAARAAADLAQRLGLDAGQIEIASVRAVEWRDGSLGCARGGMMVPQVITPGYLIVLTADGVEYEYHTNMQADGMVKFCGQGKKTKRDSGAYTSK